MKIFLNERYVTRVRRSRLEFKHNRKIKYLPSSQEFIKRMKKSWVFSFNTKSDLDKKKKKTCY